MVQRTKPMVKVPVPIHTNPLDFGGHAIRRLILNMRNGHHPPEDS